MALRVDDGSHGLEAPKRFRVLQQVELVDKPYKVTEYRARLYQNLRTRQVLSTGRPVNGCQTSSQSLYSCL